MYLICNNGYLRWPTSIFPYLQADKSAVKGYFSTNLESVQKDVECTFGILKKWWKVLNHGFKFCKMEQWEKIFIACCILHNFLLDLMVRTNVRVGCGHPIGDNGVWLDGHTVKVDTNAFETFLLTQFGMRRSLLAKHLCVRRGISQISQTCGLAPKSGAIPPSHLQIVTGTGRAAIDGKGRHSYVTHSGGVAGTSKDSHWTSSSTSDCSNRGSSSKCTMHHRLCLHLCYLWEGFAKGCTWHLLPCHPACSACSGMIEVNWNDEHGLLWHIAGKPYLCICVSACKGTNKITKKARRKQKTPS
jgi:hypothetical protein